MDKHHWLLIGGYLAFGAYASNKWNGEILSLDTVIWPITFFKNGAPWSYAPTIAATGSTS